MPEEKQHFDWSRHAILPYASLTLAVALLVAGTSLLPVWAGYDLFGGLIRYEYYQVGVFLPIPIILGVFALLTNNLGANPTVGRFVAWSGILLAILQFCIPLFSTDV